MISLRSHTISLAAVFLALAIGVALGSGLLSNTVLSGLRGDKDEMQIQIDSLTDDRNALNEKLSAAGDFDAQMAPRILRDSLAEKSVILFRTPDAADGDVEALTRVVEQAGGRVAGTVGLTQEFVDANSAEKLLSVVNSPIVPAGAQLSTGSVDQGSQAGDLLGIALLINRDPKVTPVNDTQRDTVLAALRDTGFLTYDGDHIGAADTAVVVTGGALGDTAGNQGS
ncbi:MAG: copper transporter, partial [Mycobacterium sp.]